MTRTPLQIAVEVAREALAQADAVDVDSPDYRDQIARACGALRHSLRSVLDALAADRSARLTAQADAELLNLARAARMEIHAARGSLQRLDRFEQALTRLIWPEDGGE